MKKIKNIRVNFNIERESLRNTSFKFMIHNLSRFKKSKLDIIVNQDSKMLSLEEIFFALVRINDFFEKNKIKEEFLSDLGTKFSKERRQYKVMEAKSGKKRRFILQKTNDKDIIVEQKLLLETKDGYLEKDLQNVSFYDFLLLLVIVADKRSKENSIKLINGRINKSIYNENMCSYMSKIEKEGGGFYDIVEFEDE